MSKVKLHDLVFWVQKWFLQIEFSFWNVPFKEDGDGDDQEVGKWGGRVDKDQRCDIQLDLVVPHSGVLHLPTSQLVVGGT